MHTSRRRFLRISVIGSAGVLLGCDRPPGVGEPGEGGVTGDGGAPGDDGGLAAPDAGLPPDAPEGVALSLRFPLGVSAGDVEPERAVLQTRYDGPGDVQLRVWRMDGAVFAARVADQRLQPGDGGFLHLDVAGLEPGARYRYAFFELDDTGAPGERSPLGSFRAAFAPGLRAPLTFGASCCTQQGQTPAPLARAAEHPLDLFVLLGDTSYNDGADTLAQYRTQWAANLASPEYRALRASTSVLATWDDHEVTNNFNPETIDPAQLELARKTFFEALPLRRDPAAPNRLWKSLRWGDTAEFFVLDCRSERRPSTRLSLNENVYLSRAQLDWLKAGLSASTARFKVVLNTVPITDFGFSTFTGDGWLSYRSQRTELLAHLEDQRLEGVLFLSGDHHFGSVGTASLLGRGKDLLEVLVGPGAQTANPAWVGLRPPRFPFATGTNSFTRFTLQPDTGVVTITFVDGEGETLFERDFTL